MTNSASTTMTPPSSQSTVRASCWAAGATALGRACAQRIRAGPMPYRRACAAYGEASASTMPARTSRLIEHTGRASSTATGSTSAAGWASRSPP